MRKCFVVVLVIFAAVLIEARGRRETATAATPATSSPVITPTPPVQERFFQTDTQIGYQLLELVAGNECYVNGMAKYGCKFMSALGIAQTYAQKTLTATQINGIRTETQSQGIVAADMTTNNAAAVINKGFAALGSRLSAQELRRVIDLDRIVEIYSSTIVIGETVNGNLHFSEGDHEGAIIYNPYPAAVYREITGYILIRISGYRLLDPLRSMTHR